MSTLRSTNVLDNLCAIVNQLQCNVCNQGRAICDLEARITNIESIENEIPTAILQEQQATNGTPVLSLLTAGTWNTRSVGSAVISDTGVGVTLSAGGLPAPDNGNFTLPAGKYRITASAPALGGAAPNPHRIRLQNITAGSTVLQGSNAAPANLVETRSFLRAVVDINADTTYAIQHRVTYTGASMIATWGTPANFAGEQEVYTELEIQRIGA